MVSLYPPLALITTRELMKKSGWQVFFYALMVGVGGLMGKLKAGSNPSLIFGLSFACLLVISAFFMIRGKRQGALFALALTLLLDAFFTYRFLTTYKFMPAGLMAMMSLGMVFVIASCLKQKKLKTPTS